MGSNTQPRQLGLADGMTSAYRRDHIKSVKNDEFDALAAEAQAIIIAASTAYEATVDTDTTPLVSNGERTALRRAMARFVIDSGIASVRGWI